MYQWQDLLRYGKACFDNKDWLQAEYYFKQAESDLDQLWSQNSKNIELLMAWICSSHNLATLFEEQGNIEVSLQYLLLPHQRLLMLSENQQCCEDVQLIAIWALKLTLPPLITFAEKYPMCQECQRKFTSLEQRLAHNQPLLH